MVRPTVDRGDRTSMCLSAINGLSDAPAQIEVFMLEKDTEMCIEAAKHCEPGVSDDALLVSYLLDLMQPHLGSDAPTFLCAWLAVMASSAAVLDDAPVLAGLERGDGLPSLRDPDLQGHLFAR